MLSIDAFECISITISNWKWEVFDSEIYGRVSNRIIVEKGLVGRKFENNMVIDAAVCEALCVVLSCLAKMASDREISHFLSFSSRRCNLSNFFHFAPTIVLLSLLLLSELLNQVRQVKT